MGWSAPLEPDRITLLELGRAPHRRTHGYRGRTDDAGTPRGRVLNRPNVPIDRSRPELNLLCTAPWVPYLRNTGCYVADRYLSSAKGAILSFEAACRWGRPHAQLPSKHPPPCHDEFSFSRRSHLRSFVPPIPHAEMDTADSHSFGNLAGNCLVMGT
jgi:hypothetical protein